MQFTTPVEIPRGPFEIAPCEQMLFVGSCFADSIGSRAKQEKFRAIVNPYGVMYNPASILHTIQRLVSTGNDFFPLGVPERGCPLPPWGSWRGVVTVVLTLGTNHVYILKETGEIVDNCEKRPQRLFEERELTISECAGYLRQAIDLLRSVNPSVRVILTVSPIRYRKYGFHESQLSKSILLLAIEKVIQEYRSCRSLPPLGGPEGGCLSYFPSYEIVLDELRDYRFYAPDMLHPSEQAVEYIWQRFGETYFSQETHEFLRQWKPLREALSHRPFHPDSPEYQAFLAKTRQQLQELKQRYPDLPE